MNEHTFQITPRRAVTRTIQPDSQLNPPEDIEREQIKENENAINEEMPGSR